MEALHDDQWARLRDLVPGGRKGQRGPRCDNRLFVDAPLWMARSGARIAKGDQMLRDWAAPPAG